MTKKEENGGGGEERERDFCENQQVKKESLLDEYVNHSCGRFQPLEEVLCEDPAPHRTCKPVDTAKYREFYLKMRNIFIIVITYP